VGSVRIGSVIGSAYGSIQVSQVHFADVCPAFVRVFTGMNDQPTLLQQYHLLLAVLYNWATGTNRQ
jgi:hypothetical protein